MFSKEWKLAALSIIAALTLTACPKNKKKTEPESAFKGYWINAEAYDRLVPIGGNPDPAICGAINAHPHRLGISRSWDQQLFLDAWIVYANGNVYRYTPTMTSSAADYRQRYYVGTISNGQLVSKSAIAPTYAGPQPVVYGGPLSRRAQGTTVRLNGNQMIVFAPGYGRYSVESYVRVTADQLNKMSQLVAFCSDAIRFDVVVPVYPRAVPVPGAPVPAPGAPVPGAPVPAPGAGDPSMGQQPYMGQDQFMDQQDPYMGQQGYDQQPQQGGKRSGKGSKQQLPPALEGQGQQGPAVPQQQQFNNGAPYGA